MVWEREQVDKIESLKCRRVSAQDVRKCIDNRKFATNVIRLNKYSEHQDMTGYDAQGQYHDN